MVTLLILGIWPEAMLESIISYYSTFTTVILPLGAAGQAIYTIAAPSLFHTLSAAPIPKTFEKETVHVPSIRYVSYSGCNLV